jgi:replicative DNA helicase
MSRSAATETQSSLMLSAAPLERAILSTLLDNPVLMKDVGELIEADDFFQAGGREVYQWLKSEVKAGHSPDASIALSSFMGNQKVEPYLMEVLSVLPSPNALKRQAEELRNLSIRHSTLNMLSKTMAAVSAGEGAVEADLSALTKGIQTAQLRINENQQSTRSFAQVQTKWKEKFKERVAGNKTYTPTDFDDLDRIILGLEPQDLIIVGARPSMGKTTFAMNLVENAALLRNKAVMIYSMEMPDDAIYQRSLSSIGGVDFEDMRKGTLKIGDLEKIELANEKLSQAQIFIDDTPALSLDQLCARAHRQHALTPLSLIMVDYIQLMKVAKHNLGNRNEGVGEISRGLKQLARDLNCPVVVLSQLSRELEKRPDKRPINSDLRDSGSIEQDADVIMFVYRDEVYNPDSPMKGIVEIIIGKQRNGPLGTAHLSFAKGQSRFCNLSPEQQARLESLEGQDMGKKGGKQPFVPKGFSRSSAPKQSAESMASVIGSQEGQLAMPAVLNQDHLADVADQLA